MMRLVLTMAAIAAAPSASIASESVAGTGVPYGTATTKYCMRIEAVTGSRIEQVKCWTRAEWEAQGVSVDVEWFKNGVRTVG